MAVGKRVIGVAWLLTLLVIGPVSARCADYAVAGIDDPALVAETVARLQRAVKSDDRAAVAAMVAYPVKVVLGTGRTAVRDAAAFVKHYDAIMTQAVRTAIFRQNPDDLFANSQGVMLGDGQVWFGLVGQSLRVIAINN